MTERPVERLFGRDHEQRALIALVEGRSTTNSALVEGEAGIGKTAIVEWLLREAALRSFDTLRGHCYEGRDAGPYFPFFQIFSQLRASNSESAEVLRLLSREPLGEPGSAWLGTDVRSARMRFIRSLSDVIMQIARRSQTLLVIDDLQWADAGSLLLINHLMDMSLPSVVVVLAARTGEQREAEMLQLMMRIRQKAKLVELPGLDEFAAMQLVDNELGKGQLSASEVRHLTRFAQGNPLFIRELIVHFKRHGSLRHQDVGDLLSRERMSGGLSNLLAVRASRLSESLSRVLSAASVLFGPFRPDLIACLAGVTTDEACDELEAGASEQILRRQTNAARVTYDFVHDVYRKHFYERLSANERRGLHAAIARAATQGIVALDLSQRARHAALGATDLDAGEAVFVCKQAAEQAERLLAFEEAARSWKLALECASLLDGDLVAELCRRLGWALWAAGKWAQAISAWSEAAERLDTLGDQERLAEVSLALAEVHRWRIELDDSRRWAERAASLGLASIDDKALAMALVGNARSLQNQRTEASSILEQAVTYWREGAHPSATWWIAHGFLMLGDLRRAREIALDGLAEAQRRGAASVTALLASGLLANELAFDRSAAREYLRIVEENTNRHDVAARIILLDREALFYGTAGEWQKVLNRIDEWTSEFRLAGPYQIANARMIGAAALLALGDPAQAEQQIRRALPDIEGQLPSAKLYLAEACLRQDKAEEAASLVSEVAEEVLELPRLAATRGMLGHVASELDDAVLSQRCYEALSAERRPLVMVFHCTSVQRVRGRLAAKLRHWTAAFEHFEQALEQMGRGGAYSELALALSDYAKTRRARRRRGDETRAGALEARAIELCTRLGMPAAEAGPGLPARRDPFALSTRELEVLDLAALGLRNREIAERLSLSGRTVQRHLENIYGKMGVEGRTEAVVKAVEWQLIAPAPSVRLT